MERILEKIKKVLAFFIFIVYNNSCICENKNEYAPLAQLVEHLTLNQGVQGSSP